MKNISGVQEQRWQYIFHFVEAAELYSNLYKKAAAAATAALTSLRQQQYEGQQQQ